MKSLTTLPPLIYIINRQHIHLPNLLPMRESDNSLRTHQTMYIQPLAFDVQLNNSRIFLRRQLSVDIAITLHNTVQGSYVPYVYLVNLSDDERYMLCGHLIQKSFLESVDCTLECYPSLVKLGQWLSIHAENLNLFLVFIIPLHPHLLMRLAGKKDVLLLAINCTPWLVVSV